MSDLRYRLQPGEEPVEVNAVLAALDNWGNQHTVTITEYESGNGSGLAWGTTLDGRTAQVFITATEPAFAAGSHPRLSR